LWQEIRGCSIVGPHTDWYFTEQDTYCLLHDFPSETFVGISAANFGSVVAGLREFGTLDDLLGGYFLWGLWVGYGGFAGSYAGC
jgi:hypothetical protein